MQRASGANFRLVSVDRLLDRGEWHGIKVDKQLKVAAMASFVKGYTVTLLLILYLIL